jgi:hypothetical protein
MGVKQRFHARTQGLVACTDFSQECRPLGWRQVEHGVEDLFCVHGGLYPPKRETDQKSTSRFPYFTRRPQPRTAVCNQARA